MKTIKNKKNIFLSVLLSFSVIFAVQAEEKEVSVPCEFKQNDPSCDLATDCYSQVRFTTLCAKNIKTKCLESCDVLTKDVCADRGNIASLDTRNVCANTVNTQELCAESIRSNNFQTCTRFSASVSYLNDTVYTLDTPFKFDNILDDPNNNITIAGTETYYTVPASGYYVLMLEVDLHDLVATSPVNILGAPVSQLELFVNGVQRRSSFFPWLTFSGTQKSVMTTLSKFTAGDRITTRLNVFALTDAGLQQVTGTVVVAGDGQDSPVTLFRIHYLSSTCEDLNLCTPCVFMTGTTGPCAPCQRN